MEGWEMLKIDFLTKLAELINTHENVATITERGYLKIEHCVKPEEDEQGVGYTETRFAFDDDGEGTARIEVSEALMHHKFTYLGHSPLDPTPEDVRRWFSEAMPPMRLGKNLSDDGYGSAKKVAEVVVE